MMMKLLRNVRAKDSWDDKQKIMGCFSFKKNQTHIPTKTS
jgi:hypothetical protein